MPEEPIKPVGELKPYNPQEQPSAMAGDPKSIKPVGELKPYKPPVQEYHDPYSQQQAAEERKSKAFQTIDAIPDLNEGRKEVLRDLVKRNATPEEIRTSVGALMSGDKFYFNERGVAIPLKNNQRPPKGYEVASVWGSKADTQGDSPITTVAKHVANIFPSLAENAIDLVHLPYAATAGKEAEWYKSLKNAANTLKFTTSDASKAPILNTEGIDEFKDVFDSKRWDFTADNIAGTVGQVAKSVGEFMAGGAAVKGLTGVTQASGLASKYATGFTAAYMTQLGETIDAAKEAGLDTKDAYRLGAAITAPVAMVDLLAGVEGKVFRDAIAKGQRTELTKNIVKGLTAEIKKDGGKLTNEALNDAFKATLVANTALAKTWGKETITTAASEGGQEMLQSFIEKAGHQLWDNLSDKEKAKFGEDAFGPKAFAEYLNEGIAGLIGGSGSSVAYSKIKAINDEDRRSNTAFGLTQRRDGESVDDSNTRIKSYIGNIENEVKAGKITREEADNAITRINSYTDYNKITGNLKLDDTKKRELFDKTFQKQNLETEIAAGLREAGNDPNKMHPLLEGEYQVKKKLAADLQKDINEIIMQARLDEQTTVGKKTVEDVQRKVEKEAKKNEPPKEGAPKKPAIPAHLKAILDRHKEAIDNSKYEDYSVEDFNMEKRSEAVLDARKRHKILASHIYKQPGKRVPALLKLKKFIDKKGNTNTTVYVQFADGKRIRYASSMDRLDGWAKGYFRQERVKGLPIGVVAKKTPSGKLVIKTFNPETGHFVGWIKETNKGGSSKEYDEVDKKFFEDEQMNDRNEPPLGGSPAAAPNITPPSQPDGGSVPSGNSPTAPTNSPNNNEIEADYLLTGGIGTLLSTDYLLKGIAGVFSNANGLINEIRNKYAKELADKNLVDIKNFVGSETYNKIILEIREALNQSYNNTEVQKIFDDILKYPTGMPQRVGLEIEQRLENLQPTAQQNVQPILNQPNQPQNGEQQPEQAGAANAAQPETGNNREIVPADSANIEGQEAAANTGATQAKIATLRQKVATYNSHNRTEKKALGSLLAEITQLAGELGMEGFIQKGSNIKITKNGRRFVFEKKPPRPEDVIAQEKADKAFRERALNATPTSVRHMVIMDIANSERFDLKALNTIKGEKAVKNDVPPLLKQEGGLSPEFYKTRVEEHGGSISDEMDEQEIAEEVADTVLEFGATGSQNYRLEAIREAEDILFRQENNGMSKQEIADLEADMQGVEQMNEEAEGEPLLENKDPEEVEEIFDFFEGLSDEELEEIAEEQRIFQEWYDAVKSGDKQTYVETMKRHLKEREDSGYTESDSKFYDQYFSQQWDRLYKPSEVYQKKSSLKDSKYVDKVVALIQKAMPKVNVVYDKTLNAAGKLSGNTIYINPYHAGTDTAIHEAGHVLIDAIGYDNKVIQAAIAQLKGSDLWKETEEGYPELSEKDLGIEVLAEAIGREGADIFTTKEEQSKFKTFLDYIFDWFKRKLGMEKNIAKKLAQQIIAGEGTKELTGQKETATEKEAEPVLQKKKGNKKLNEFREKVLGRDIEQEQADIAAIQEAMKDDDISDDDYKQLESVLDSMYDQIEEDEQAFQDFKDNQKNILKVVEAEDLSGFTLEELIHTYNEMDGVKKGIDKQLFDAAKLRIAYFIQNREIDRLSDPNGPAVQHMDKIANSKDMTWTEVWFKTLSDISEKFPVLQGLSREFDARYLKKAQDTNAKKRKLEKLGKAVIKEKNKALGVISDLIRTDSAKYFEFVEDNGKLRTNTAGLTETQKNYLEYMHELVKDRNTITDEDGNEVDNTLIRMDKGFQETYRTEGMLAALNQYLGGNNNNEANVSYNDPVTGIPTQSTYIEAQTKILNHAKQNGNFLQALFQLIKIAYQAKKEGKIGAYTQNYHGKLTSKFDHARPKDKGYSKDYYKAAFKFIEDSAHVENMKDMVPIIRSIELFYQKMGMEKPGQKFDNVLKFLQEWQDEQIYQHQKVTEPAIDFAFKTLRGLTSKIVMAFNYPANVMNVAIGNYQNWRQEGSALWATGNKRFFGNTKKSMAILKHYDVVSHDYDSNPKIHIGKFFDDLAYWGNRIGETQIQGSMFLGQLSDEEWNAMSVGKDGELEIKLPNGVHEDGFNEKMIQYKNRVSDIQGKYGEKDRRNFMRFEAGKAASQFKTFIPDFWKERMGKQFVDKNGIKRGGTWKVMVNEGFKEIKEQFKTDGTLGAAKAIWNNKATMANLKGLMLTAVLLVAVHTDDDDEKQKRKVLSVENGLQNMLFIFDPQQLKYLLESPVAGIGTVTKFIQAVEDLMKGDFERVPKDVKKVIPYNKIVDQATSLVGDDE